MESISPPDSMFPESDTSLVARCRVLVVDADPVRRSPLKRILQREGFLVVEADSGQEAIRVVFAQEVDLVVLDLPSPPTEGLKLLAQLRAKHDQTALPVILVTPCEDPRQVVKAIEWGANDYVTRPVDPQVFLARVNTQVRLRRAHVALRESEERYAIAARGANDGLWDWNLITDDVYYSPRWLEMLGLTTSRVTACPNQWFSRVHAEDQARVQAELESHCRGETPHFETEVRMLHEDGGFRWMLCRGLAVRDAGGKAVRIAGSLTDITEGKVADALTGLPNRLLFIDRLQRAIRRRRENNAHNFAVLYLDVDNFKLINDSLGHSFGDELLMAVANRVENCIRARETIVARLGGDEFAVLIEGIPSLDAVQLVADRVIYAISRPFIFHGREVYTSTSIGIAMAADQDGRAEDLLREADTAMYQAKARGRNCYQVYDPNMQEQVSRRLELEGDLRRALERTELQLFYQPIVNLSNGEIHGFEALVRWYHPTRGLVTPDNFIRVAEETGLIVPLGGWVLNEACRQVAEWQEQGYPELMVSVNVSSKQLAAAGFIDAVSMVLVSYAIPPHSLKLEITESAIMENPEAGAAMLSELRALGVCVGIDDFGTGYSSLASLHRLPLDVLKVDRSFVMKMHEAEENLAIVRTIVTLAQSLRLAVVAEGIETHEQCATLAQLGCQYGQGYLFSRPLEAQDADALMKQPPFDLSYLNDAVTDHAI